MSIDHWRQAWEQLIAPGSPFEVVTPADGGPRYFRHAPRNLLQVIDAARVHGDKEFVVWQQQRLSFAAYFDAVDRLAGQLAGPLGLRPGERVAIAMRNQPAWLVAFAAIQRCGAVCVPLNSWGLHDELLHGVEDSGARLLIGDEARLALLQDDLAASGRTFIVVGRAAAAKLPAHCLRYEDLLAAAPLPVAAVDIEPQAPR